MAILVLNGADFSANNIGQITLPEDMHEYTRKIFMHCTRFSIYSKQAEVINDFVSFLDNEGLLEHISMMIAPWLANDASEAVYNIASDNQLTINGSEYTFENGLLNMSSTTCYVVTNSIPFSTFFGSLLSTKQVKQFSPAFIGSNYNTPAIIGQSSTSLGVLTSTLAGNGYKINSIKTQCFIANVKGYQDFNSNGTNINGSPLVVTSGYDKSTEPFTDAVITRIIPQWNQSAKTIIFAGDGTILTDEQLSSLTSKMQEIQNRLVALES